jgi:hypothetical protein
MLAFAGFQAVLVFHHGNGIGAGLSKRFRKIAIGANKSEPRRLQYRAAFILNRIQWFSGSIEAAGNLY